MIIHIQNQRIHISYCNNNNNNIQKIIYSQLFIKINMQISQSLPKITLKDLNLQKFSNSTLDIIKQQKLPKLYTVAQSLQDAYVLKNLKPELGSLNQFLEGTSPLRKQTMIKKKKNDKPEQTQQKRIRSHMALRKKTPEDILKSKESTLVERKVACKMILQGIFIKEFGQQPDSFYNNNLKEKDRQEIPIKIQKFLQRYENIPPLEILLDQYINLKEENQNECNIKIAQNKKVQQHISNKEIRYSKKVLKYSQDKIKSELIKIKSKYKVLTKIKLITIGNQQGSTYEAEHHLKNSQYQYSELEFEQDEEYKSQCRRTKSMYKQDNKQTYLLTKKYFVIKNVEVSAQFFMFITLNFISFENIKKIHLQQITIPEEILCTFFEMINKFSIFLESLTLIGIQTSQRFIHILQTTISTSNLKNLCLNNINLNTKMFCMICLGIGQNNSLISFEASGNKIDSRALKSIQIIIKFVIHLQYIDLTGNKFNHLDEKTIEFLNHAKNKIVLVGKPYENKV